MGQKNFSQKIFGSKNKKYLGKKKIWGQKKFWVKKILGQKNFGS